MKILANYPLLGLNTFRIEVSAAYFSEFDSLNAIQEFITLGKFRNKKKFVLGGGSNVLFANNFEGIVLKISISGKELVGEDNDFYYVKVGAGENWHQFVLYCIEHDYSGAENLSLIPGCVGAAPIQNIGAYGVELKEIFHELEAVDIRSGTVRKFSKTDCRFAYRDSIFKNEAKDKYIIASVTLRLRKKPVFNISYGAIEKELERMGVKELSISAISRAVCNIRNSKLPNPDQIGNAGSFFKNPVVSNEKFETLKKEFPQIVAYKNSEGDMKLAAGWLIEHCGWKGKKIGDAGVHKNQALVLVNYGKARGEDILELSHKIHQSVKDVFGIELQLEVNVV